MAHDSTTQPSWDTASLGLPAGASALEHSALSAHLHTCSGLRGPLQVLQTGAGELRQLLSERVVTSVLFLAVLLGSSWLMR
jgi:hypothetical protein